MSYPQLMKFVDFVIGVSSAEDRCKRVIFKLCFKKQLKEYPSLLKYFKVNIKYLIFYQYLKYDYQILIHCLVIPEILTLFSS